MCRQMKFLTSLGTPALLHNIKKVHNTGNFSNYHHTHKRLKGQQQWRKTGHKSLQFDEILAKT